MVDYWLEPSCERGLVSIIIPCHNQGHFLQACLDSLTDQEYRPLEIIIVDDGSSDNTKNIMQTYQEVQKSGVIVKCIYQSKRGAQAARNVGCRQARGEFIQFLDADDILFPRKLSEQAMVFKNNSEADVIYGNGQYLIDGFGTTLKKGRIISMGPTMDMIGTMLSGAEWVPPFSYLSRKSAVQRCGPWNEEIQILQDFEYFLRMAIRGCRFLYNAGLTGLYRKHSVETISEQSVTLRERARRSILAQAERDLKESRELTENRMRAIAENYMRIARRSYPRDIE
jgi:glycosyltransferase involved in cell wall biosynthesis